MRCASMCGSFRCELDDGHEGMHESTAEPFVAVSGPFKGFTVTGHKAWTLDIPFVGIEAPAHGSVN